MSDIKSNDFFIEENNLVSGDNPFSLIKCLLQIACLGSIFNDTHNMTLDNAFLFLAINGNTVYFSAKYWSKSLLDISKKDYTTADIIKVIQTRITNDSNLKTELKKNLHLDSTFDFSWSFYDTLFNFQTEYFDEHYKGKEYIDYSVKSINSTINTEFFNAIHIFKCCYSLTNDLKINFALFISGILGHMWDKVYSYFYFIDEKTFNEELFKLRSAGTDNDINIYVGSPLASYFYDFKKSSDKNLLGGFNASNFHYCLKKGILGISDNLSQPKVYLPKVNHCALFPIVYNNAILNINTRIFITYRKLLSLFRTRKQRDFLMDNLTPYGRQLFTILDPYGLFMHFHSNNETVNPIS